MTVPEGDPQRETGRKERAYLARESHLLGGVTTLLMYALWPPLAFVWLSLVAVLWVWSLATSGRQYLGGGG